MWIKLHIFYFIFSQQECGSYSDTNEWHTFTVVKIITSVWRIATKLQPNGYKTVSSNFKKQVENTDQDFLQSVQWILKLSENSTCYCFIIMSSEGLGLVPVACSLTLKVELVPPPFPRACYISSPFRFILQCLLEYLLSRSTYRMQFLDYCKQLIQTVCPRSHYLRVQVSHSNLNHIKITITDCTGAFQRSQLQL